MHRSLKYSAIAIFLLLSPFITLADNSVGKSDDETGSSSASEDFLPDSGLTALNEIVVTATRTPKSLKDVPVVTRIISSEEIAKTDASNIQDLLTEELPGLEEGTEKVPFYLT